MFQKVRNQALLAVLFFVLTLAQQYGFYAFKGFPIIWLSFGKYLSVLLFFFILTLVKGPKTRFFFLSLIMLMNAFQMGHLSYFGTQVLPNEIYLLFAEMGEVTGTVGQELQHIFIPLLFTLIPLGIGLYWFRKLPTQFSFRFVTIILIAWFIYNPVRTAITGNTWGRQPSTRELSGMNVYLSVSYFLGKILPAKLSDTANPHNTNESLALKLTKNNKPLWDNIIVVLGESLSPHQMSHFGYKRNTTPFLDTQIGKPTFFSTIGLSSGVSTDVSVAFFLNMGYGDTGALKASKGEHCLFKSAKGNGYATHFLSIQSGDQLRYIAPYLCTAYLDDYRSLESIAPATKDHNAALDRDLLPKLDELLKNQKKNFIVLHQRGSHSPWNLRSTKESTKFNDPAVDERKNDYDNSVYEFDLFWKDLTHVVSSQKSKTLVIYLSDHGESLGMNKLWGHGFLAPSSFEVPMLIQAFNHELPAKTKELPKFLPNYNLALYTTQVLGYETSQSPFDVLKDFVIYGNDIDGFAGKAEITFDEKSYRFKVLP